MCCSFIVVIGLDVSEGKEASVCSDCGDSFIGLRSTWSEPAGSLSSDSFLTHLDDGLSNSLVFRRGVSL